MPHLIETKIDQHTFTLAVDRFYNAEGVWALAAGRMVRVGVSDFVQWCSGAIRSAVIQPVGTVLAVNEAFAVIKIRQAVIALPSPVAGKIVRVNQFLETMLDLINQDPFEHGWLCQFEATDWETDRRHLLDASTYIAQIRRKVQDTVEHAA